jgi:hypothetical protein
MSMQNKYELRVDLADWEGNTSYAVYDLFEVEVQYQVEGPVSIYFLWEHSLHWLFINLLKTMLLYKRENIKITNPFQNNCLYIYYV